jgi:CBS domain-containing protein
VVDGKGKLAGIITVTDILRLQVALAAPARARHREGRTRSTLRELHQRIQS